MSTATTSPSMNAGLTEVEIELLRHDIFNPSLPPSTVLVSAVVTVSPSRVVEVVTMGHLGHCMRRGQGREASLKSHFGERGRCVTQEGRHCSSGTQQMKAPRMLAGASISPQAHGTEYSWQGLGCQATRVHSDSRIREARLSEETCANRSRRGLVTMLPTIGDQVSLDEWSSVIRPTHPLPLPVPLPMACLSSPIAPFGVRIGVRVGVWAGLAN